MSTNNGLIYRLAPLERSDGTIQMAGLDPAKCAQRNRLDALRNGINTAEMKLSRQVGAPPPDGARLISAFGVLPTNIEGELSLINAMLPHGAPDLLEADVYPIYMQGANNRFIPDRYMFLGSSTLKNIARGGSAGFSFMNSHRTGSVSTPSEQPFGKTFVGRFERYENPDPLSIVPGFERAILGAYMLQGVLPNGANGPSTDHMYRSIMGGVLADVSMGVYQGTLFCDICGNDVEDHNCSHIPGTGYNVSPDDARRQKARGVEDGLASGTLEDGVAGEVSGVYDGAVPGAGFSKAMHVVNHTRLSPEILAQVRRAYSRLLREEDIRFMGKQLDQSQKKSYAGFTSLLAEGEGVGTQQGTEKEATVTETDETKVTEETTEAPSAEEEAKPSSSAPVSVDVTVAEPKEEAANSAQAQQLAVLSARDEALRAREEKLAEMERAARLKSGSDIAHRLAAESRIFDAGKPTVAAFAARLLQLDDEGAPPIQFTNAANQKRSMSLSEAFGAIFEDVPQHSLFTDHKAHEVPADAVLLRGGDGGSGDAVEDELREQTRQYAQKSNTGKKEGKAESAKK